jgi:hypothetical protein
MKGGAMYNYIKLRYKMKKITAAEVWAYVDSGVLTEEEAEKICGARPA